MISKGPLGEVPTLPTAMKSSYTSAAQAWEPTAEGSGPSSFHQQVFQKWMARKQGGRQAKGRGPGTPLWKGSSASSGGRPGGTRKWEGANARSRLRLGKGVLSPSFFPLPPAEPHRAPGGKVGRTQSRGQPWTLSSGPPQAPSPSVPQKRERPPHWRFSPTEEINAGRRRESRPPSGATQPGIQAEKPVWPYSLPPIGSLRAGTGARWM